MNTSRAAFAGATLAVVTLFAARARAQTTTTAGAWTLALGFSGGAPFRGNAGDSNPLAVGLGLRVGRTFAGSARFHLGFAAQYHPRAEGSLKKWWSPDGVWFAVDLGGDIPVWRLTLRPYVGLGAMFADVRSQPVGSLPGTHAVDMESSSPFALSVQPGASVLWRHGRLLLGADVRVVVALAEKPAVGTVLFTALVGLSL